MDKEIKNTNDFKVRTGVQSCSDSTPVCRPKCERALFFVLNINTLQKLGSKNLAFYLKLKPYFKNSCFYNYSINKISKYAGCSNVKAKKYINNLINIGLIEVNNGNLVLKKIKRGKVNRKIYISTEQSIQQINDRLLLLLIQHKNNQMSYITKKKNTPKGILADCNKSKYEPSNNVIGTRKLSEYLKVSTFYLCHFTNRMIKSKKLKVKRVKVNLGKTAIFNDFVSHYLFKDKRGNTIHYVGSVYSLL